MHETHFARLVFIRPHGTPHSFLIYPPPNVSHGMRLFSLLVALSSAPFVSLLASPIHDRQFSLADYHITPEHHGDYAGFARRHRNIPKTKRQELTYKHVYWAFGEDAPKTNDLPTVKDALEIVAGGNKDKDQPTATQPALHPAPPTISLHNSIPIGSLSASAPTPTTSDSVINIQNDSDPGEDASRKHKIISVIVIAGFIFGLILLVGVLRVINGPNLWFMRKKDLLSDAEAGVKKIWDWQRLSNPPKNFGTKSLLHPKKAEEEALRRQYDERGIERGTPESKEENVVVIQPQVKLIQLDTPHQSLIPGPPVKEATPAFPPALATPVDTSPESTPPSLGPVLSVASFEDDIQYPNPISLPVSSSSVSGSTTFSSPTRSKSVSAVPTAGGDPTSRHASTQRSHLSSEWDIAGAYSSRTRSERSRSTGTMSALSIDSKEWQYKQKTGRRSGRNSGRVVSG